MILKSFLAVSLVLFRVIDGYYVKPLHRIQAVLYAKRRTILSRGREAEKSSEVVDDDLNQTSPTPSTPAISPLFSQDYQDFLNRAKEKVREDPNAREEMKAVKDDPRAGLVESLKNSITYLLIVDFFVVLFFLAWFLLGAALQSVNPAPLQSFQACTDLSLPPSSTSLASIDLSLLRC